MIFKKKEKIEPPSKEVMERISEYDKKILNEINTLMLLNSLNESNKILGKICNAEYESTKAYIMHRCDELENALKFNNMMGNPMDSLERLFND